MYSVLRSQSEAPRSAQPNPVKVVRVSPIHRSGRGAYNGCGWPGGRLSETGLCAIPFPCDECIMSDDRLVEIFRARDNFEARLLTAALEDVGIRAHVSGEQLQGILAAVPFGWSTAPRILVFEADAPRARAILDDLEESRRPQ